MPLPPAWVRDGRPEPGSCEDFRGSSDSGSSFDQSSLSEDSDEENKGKGMIRVNSKDSCATHGGFAAPKQSGFSRGRQVTEGGTPEQADDAALAGFDSKTRFLLRDHMRRAQLVAESIAELVKTAKPTQACKIFMACADRVWDSQMSVELCLQESFAPKLRDVSEDCQAQNMEYDHDAALHCHMLSPEGTGCNNDLARLLGRTGIWLDETVHHHAWRLRLLKDHDAMRTCLQRGARVSDRLPRGYLEGTWLFSETARAAKGFSREGAPLAHVYWPLRGRDGCIGVLHMSTSSSDEFSNAKQESFAPLVEAMGMQLCALRLQVLLDSERRRQQSLANDYRSMLETMLPPHVIDELNQARSPQSRTGQDPSPEANSDGGDDVHRTFSSRQDTEASSVGCMSTTGTLASLSPRSYHRKKRLPTGTLTSQRASVGSQWLSSRRIVERLDKLGYAEYHDCVAILFTDIKGFTSLSERSDPGCVMVMLDDLFGRFDDIVDAYAPVAYKVETIGDAYMVAFGLFEQEADGAKAAVNAVQVAANMIKAAREVDATLSDGSLERVEIRAGIALGQIMSGIIGKKMLRYCMFGDTVNTASRMESTGTAGQVHVAENVRDACLNSPEGQSLKFTHTGGREVKGKGFMNTYLLDPNQVLGLEE